MLCVLSRSLPSDLHVLVANATTDDVASRRKGTKVSFPSKLELRYRKVKLKGGKLLGSGLGWGQVGQESLNKGI